MASLLKMDIKDLFKKKSKDSSKAQGSSAVNGVVIKRILIVIILFAIVFGAYYFFFLPTIGKQEIQIKQIAKWEQQVISCNSEIYNLEKNIQLLIEESDKKGGLFVSDEEFENFYAELTEATVRNGLTIRGIERGEVVPVRAPSATDESSYDYNYENSAIPCGEGSKYSTATANATNTSSQDCEGGATECAPIAYYKMLVSYEITGPFGSYLEFRNIIANQKKIVNIENETIIKNIEKPGQITAKATVSLVKNSS